MTTFRTITIAAMSAVFSVAACQPISETPTESGQTAADVVTTKKELPTQLVPAADLNSYKPVSCAYANRIADRDPVELEMRYAGAYIKATGTLGGFSSGGGNVYLDGGAKDANACIVNTHVSEWTGLNLGDEVSFYCVSAWAFGSAERVSFQSCRSAKSILSGDYFHEVLDEFREIDPKVYFEKIGHIANGARSHDYSHHTCAALSSENDANEVRFNNMFEDRLIVVYGTVTDISANAFDGTPQVSLSNGNSATTVDDCTLTFPNDDFGPTRLSKGEREAFFCGGAKAGLFGVTVSDCASRSAFAVGNYRHRKPQ